jgi:hypothetical protein
VNVAPFTKLRLAVADGPSALQVATAKVHLATGLGVRPEFQEIDRSDLIVELSLSDTLGCTPGQLGRLVERSSTDLEVLSCWTETKPTLPTGRHQQPKVVQYNDPDVPFTARRAFDDCLPTAGWQVGTDGVGPHWLLAVPAVSFDDRIIAAILLRSGYCYRFSALEATTLRASLGRPRAA